MFERVVTARYIHNHPAEASAFGDFDYVQRRKLARALEERLGFPEEMRPQLVELNADADRVENQFVVTDCETCDSKRVNYTWHKYDVPAMAANTERSRPDATPDERKEARETKRRFQKMATFGYFDPMGHTHATFRSMASAFGEENGEMKRVVADYGVVDRTVWTAHQIVLEGLLVAGQRFNPPQFEDAFRCATEHFAESWRR